MKPKQNDQKCCLQFLRKQAAPVIVTMKAETLMFVEQEKYKEALTMLYSKLCSIPKSCF